MGGATFREQMVSASREPVTAGTTTSGTSMESFTAGSRTVSALADQLSSLTVDPPPPPLPLDGKELPPPPPVIVISAEPEVTTVENKSSESDGLILPDNVNKK